MSHKSSANITATNEGLRPSTPYNPSERNTQLKREHLMAMYGWYSPPTAMQTVTRFSSAAEVTPQPSKRIEEAEIETAEMPVLASAGV